MSFSSWIERELGQNLAALLGEQRWFASKSRPIRDADCEDIVLVPDATIPLALVIVRVAFDASPDERYGVLVAAVKDPSGLPLIGVTPESESIVEGGSLPAAGRALIRALAGAPSLATLRGGRVQRHDMTDDTAAALSEADDVRTLGAEQSNTSIRIDRRFVFKLIRRLEDGENPELEIGRVLSRTTFRGSPRLHGAWTWLSGDGRAATIGLLQDWIDNQGDGWSHVLDRLGRSAGEAEPQLLDELATLGTTTADLHAALSVPTEAAFRPVPLTDDVVATWHHAFVAVFDRVCNTLRRASLEASESRSRARDLLAQEARVREWRPPDLGADTFDTIRIHGDYHLGQTLKTTAGFVIIDFEGEPARPLATRRRRHAAMRDVAGMLRSFDYAVETVRATRPDRFGGHDPLLAMRQAFLDGYVDRAIAADGRFIPRDRRVLDRWVRFFELDKALYEVEYELNNRPGWVHIPLGGVLRLIEG